MRGSFHHEGPNCISLLNRYSTDWSTFLSDDSRISTVHTSWSDETISSATESSRSIFAMQSIIEQYPSDHLLIAQWISIAEETLQSRSEFVVSRLRCSSLLQQSNGESVSQWFSWNSHTSDVHSIVSISAVFIRLTVCCSTSNSLSLRSSIWSTSFYGTHDIE